MVRKRQPVICVDCGVEISTTNSRTLRCKECKRKKKNEYRRQWEKKTKNTPDVVTRKISRAVTERDDFFGCDSPADIQSCLNCEKEKCNNCLSSLGERRKYERRKEEVKNG